MTNCIDIRDLTSDRKAGIPASEALQAIKDALLAEVDGGTWERAFRGDAHHTLIALTSTENVGFVSPLHVNEVYAELWEGREDDAFDRMAPSERRAIETKIAGEIIRTEIAGGLAERIWDRAGR